jgi:branched-chain amino acid transport system substrate-binding protein
MRERGNVTDLTRRQTLAIAGTAVATLALPAAAQSTNPIKIGFSMALSGGLAGGGNAALLAYQIWAEEVNSKGGLLGRKVDLVYYDDQSSPAAVPGIYSKLLDIDKVDLVVSGYATVIAAAAMPFIIEHRKLFLSIGALAVNDQFNYDRYFQVFPNGPDAKVEISKGFFELAGNLTPRPKTVALVGADAEFSILALEGARENAKKTGIKIVYDHTYPPNSVDFSSIIRAIKSTNPDLLFIASYPPDSAGVIRSIYDVGFGARMVGGFMTGLQYGALKQQPTMKFPGIEQFLVKYRERAVQAGVDPLGFYIPPFAYAEMQILEAAVKAARGLDDNALADFIRAHTFSTIVGDIKFGTHGEWAEPRVLLVQYRDIVGNDIDQFKQAGKQVIVYPPRYKSGELRVPFTPTKR